MRYKRDGGLCRPTRGSVDEVAGAIIEIMIMGRGEIKEVNKLRQGKVSIIYVAHRRKSPGFLR